MTGLRAKQANDLIQKGMAEGIKMVFNKPMDINLLVSIFRFAKGYKQR